MRKTITAYIILLTSSLCLILPPACAQTDGNKPKEESKEEVPLYNGCSIGIDVFGLGNQLFGGSSISSEVSFDVNLKNRFFPIVEIGYGHTDTTDEEFDIHYRSSAPYFRIGMDYNTMSKKKSENFLFAGIRYGFSTFKYDVSAPALQDPVWEGTVPFGYDGIGSHAHWLELLLGIKVKIVKNFRMGWTLRYKARLNVGDNRNATPWYIPGYGSNKSTNFGFTYNFIYQLPF